MNEMRKYNYNIRKREDGNYEAYMPTAPFLEMPESIGSRNKAMGYIAAQHGLTLSELKEALKRGDVVLYKK